MTRHIDLTEISKKKCIASFVAFIMENANVMNILFYKRLYDKAYLSALN